MNARSLDENGWLCPTGEEMRRIDRDAIERLGLPGRVLMETAGRAVAAAVRARYPQVRRPLLICGGGNNGGDGYVVARVLHDWDDRIEPVVMAVGDPARHSPEARANLELLSHAGVQVVERAELKDLEAWLGRCDLVVDALFGVGVSRPLEGLAASVVDAIARCSLPVVAVDLPSGIASDTGESLGPAPRADLIVTLGLPKRALAVRAFEGAEVLVADIGLPVAAIESVDVRQRVLTVSAAARRLPTRPPEGHKGTFGHVLVVAGSPGKSGAAVLAAMGALRAGAGLVTVAAPALLAPLLAVKLNEAMTLALPESETGALGAGAAARLLEEAARRDVLVVGPGLGVEPETARVISELLGALERPAVVDADGLTAFAGRARDLRADAARVLTPHPGEMARLLGCSIADVQRDRVETARELANRSGAVVVLKGARTVVAEPAEDGRGLVYINPTGSPALASGGSGDVLAGIVGALLAQGVDPLDAAALGVYLHGAAGDSGRDVGGLAGEVAERVPAVWSALATAESEARGTGSPDREGLRRFP